MNVKRDEEIRARIPLAVEMANMSGHRRNAWMGPDIKV